MAAVLENWIVVTTTPSQPGFHASNLKIRAVSSRLLFSFLFLSCLVLSLFLCFSLSLSVSVSLSLSPCGGVCVVWCVVSCGLCAVCCACWCGCCCCVWCVVVFGVWCGTQKKPPCVDSKRPRVYRHHAHMCQNMRAWFRYTRVRSECTHGGFFGQTHGERGRGCHRQFCLPRLVHVVITCSRGSPKETTGCYKFQV